MNNIDEIFAAQEKLFCSAFDKAKTYSQIIAGLGYAGIFTAWTFAKPFLSRGEILWSALLASVSIATFVLFEVFTTFFTSRALLGIAKALEDKSRFVAVLQKQEADEKRLKLVYAKAWLVLWPASFVSGVAAAVILIGAFVGHLWSGH